MLSQCKDLLAYRYLAGMLVYYTRSRVEADGNNCESMTRHPVN